MAIITQADAIARAQAIRDETVVNANTAVRVGQLLADIAESASTWAGPTGPTGPTGATGPTGPAGATGPIAGTNGQIIYNGGGTPAGTTFTTDGQNISGLRALNGTRVANGVLGAPITGSVSVSVSGGSVYEIPGPLGSNIIVTVLATGSPKNGHGISFRRFDTTGFKVTFNDQNGNFIYSMDGGAEICEMAYSTADGKFTNPSHQPLG